VGVARNRLRGVGHRHDVVSTMEKFTAEQAAEIMRRARENIERPVGISPAPVPPPEDRNDRHRRELAEDEQRHAAEQDASEVARLRAQIDDLRGDLLNLARATRECMDGLGAINDERAAAFNTLRDKLTEQTSQLHDARLDLANVRGDLSALKLALADQRAARALDLPDAPRRLQ
jgi:predicted DNA-binding ribbon-helix-helix protein